MSSFRRQKELYIGDFRKFISREHYTLEEIQRLVEESGLQFVAAYEAFTKEAPSDTHERIYVIAREQGKKYEEMKRIKE